MRKGISGDLAAFYHGTDRVFDRCKKDVFWASSMPDLANDYAELREDISKSGAILKKVWISANKSFDADKLEKTIRIGAFLMEVAKQSEQLTGQRPDDEMMKSVLNLLRNGSYREESGPWYSPQDFWFNPHEKFGHEESKSITNLLQELGFDSISFTEQGVPTIGVLSNGMVQNAISGEIIHGNEVRAELFPFKSGSKSFIDKISYIRRENEDSLAM